MRKSRFIVPNFFTGLNFLIGIFSILVMIESVIRGPGEGSILGTGKAPVILAAWMVVWCVLLDKLDGFAAKLLKASSEFGAQFDSLADLVAFGVTPGLLVYFFAMHLENTWFLKHRPLMVVSIGLYMLCAAMRLARYNAVDVDELKDFFHGLPSTFAGGFVALTVILVNEYQVHNWFSGAILLLPLVLIVTGLLMVSPFYLPKLVKRESKWINFVQAIGVFGGYICGFGMVFPLFLFSTTVIYGVVGFSYGFYKKGVILPPDDTATGA